MNRKKIVIVVFICLISLMGYIVMRAITVVSRYGKEQDRKEEVAIEVEKSPLWDKEKPIPSQAERLQMSLAERMEFLEAHGRVPGDAHETDYLIAEHTSWWGRKPDPVTFWSNRVVWLDGWARATALRLGRRYPPIPPGYDDYSDHSEEDIRTKSYTGYSRYYTSRESAFWRAFGRNYYRPPWLLDVWLRRVAKDWVQTEWRNAHEPHPRIGPIDLDRRLERLRDEARQVGYPLELVDPEVFRWTYILQKREEFQKLLDDGWGEHAGAMSNYFANLHIDRRYIMEPMSEEDIRAANAGKIAYLQRLHKEGTDASYVNAYMEAWDLTGSDVFDDDANEGDNE